MKKFTIFAILFFLAVIFSCKSPIPIKKYVYDPKAPEAKGDVTISGKLVCLNCSFEPSEEARRFCEENGHNNVLRSVEGTIYSIVRDAKTKELIESGAFCGKAVIITGRIIINSRAIKVSSYELF